MSEYVIPRHIIRRLMQAGKDLIENQEVRYINNKNVATKGVVLRNTQGTEKLYVTVVSNAGDIEVITDEKKIVGLS